MTHPTSADICHANGWNVGDILEGEDRVGNNIIIRITAIGEDSVLARRMHAELPESSERLIDLGFRDWHKVGQK